MEAVDTKSAINKLKKAVKDAKKDMNNEIKALGKGLYIAMSNASVKKGTGKKPKPGSKRARGEDWGEGPDLKVRYEANGRIYESTAEQWLANLKAKNAGRESYMDKNGKMRTRRANPYRIVPLKNQKKPGTLFKNDLWRKGSKGTLPFSWRGDGLANYYLRKQWNYDIEDLETEVKISPATFKGENNNERVLKLLDTGGTTKGSRQLKGFRLYFWHDKNSPKTNVGIKREYSKERPTVRIKGFNLKRQVLARVNRVLKRVKPSQITTQHWRQLGKG